MNHMGVRDCIERTTARIAALFGYGTGAVFGRGRSGLAAILEIVGDGADVAVIMPSNICPSVYAAAIATGAEIRFAPVEAETGLPPDSGYASRIGEGRGVVMVTHLYGFVADYPETRRMACQHGWLVVENDTAASRAQAAAGAPRTAFGDALLMSFGAGKVIDAGGGGAVLTDDGDLAASLRERAGNYPPLDADAEETETRLALLRRLLRRGLPKTGPMSAHYQGFLDYEVGEVRYRLPDDGYGRLDEAIDRAAETIAGHRDRWFAWRQALAPLSGQVIAAEDAPPSPWRFIARIPHRRDAVVGALRENGFDAGTNYPPLTDFFPDAGQPPLPAGPRTWADEVINLWIDPTYDDQRIAAATAVIAGALGR